MWKETFREIVWILGFIIFVVIFFTVVFKVSDWQEIAATKTVLEAFIKNLDEAKSSPREITLELPSLVDRIEIVPANTGKGKYCMSQTCESKCLESPYYIYVSFNGKNNMQCVGKYLCCNVQFTETTLLGTSSSNSIGGKISYTMQVTYDAEKGTYNAVVISSKDKEWGEKIKDVGRSIFG